MFASVYPASPNNPYHGFHTIPLEIIQGLPHSAEHGGYVVARTEPAYTQDRAKAWSDAPNIDVMVSQYRDHAPAAKARIARYQWVMQIAASWSTYDEPEGEDLDAVWKWSATPSPDMTSLVRCLEFVGVLGLPDHVAHYRAA